MHRDDPRFGRPAVVLVLGGGVVERRLRDPVSLLLGYREDEGTRYLNHKPITPSDELLPEDLAVTLLVNSRAGYRAFKSIQDLGPSLDLAGLPAAALENTAPGERDRVADLISQVAGWPGFAASLATKVLHKKRPALIPILDNQAIFGAYMAATWPRQSSSQDSVKEPRRIREALERIAVDLTREENREVWPLLQEREPARSLIELLDMTWWSYFRRLEDRSGTLRARLRRLAAFLPVFEAPGFEFGSWAPTTTTDGTTQMPHYMLGAEAEEFAFSAHELGWVMDFDWMAWAQSDEGRALLAGGDALVAATPDELVRVLTTVIRSERFGEGQLATAFESGLLTAVLRRVVALIHDSGLGDGP